MGLSRRETLVTKTLVGTPIYMAPEVSNEKPYNRKADIYALGLIMWEIWYGKRVDNLIHHRHGTTSKNLPDNAFDQTPRPPDVWIKLITKSCLWDPNTRPSGTDCYCELRDLLLRTNYSNSIMTPVQGTYV